MVDGSEWCSGGVPGRYKMHLSAEMECVHFAIAREIDSTGNTDPSKLVYEVSATRFDAARPAVGI